MKWFSKKKRIFFDYASITPLDPEVEREMSRVQHEAWANPSSLHSEGEKAKQTLEKARTEIAALLHAKSSEIYFTSGGTESLNLAIQGVVKSYVPRGEEVPHVIVSTIEHPAIREPLDKLVHEGKVSVSFVSPSEEGIISPLTIEREMREETVLVIVQHANNEIGTIQPIQKIAHVVKEARKQRSFVSPQFLEYPYLLVDASQSVLYETVSLERLQADLIVLDGIKMYGPRGSGVLVVRHGALITPLMYGGGQESGLRSGTEAVAYAAGFALALKKASELRESESKRLNALRDYLIEHIIKNIPNSHLNGDQKERLPNNVNICFDKEGIDSEFLVIKLDTLGFAVSAASACHTLSLENSSYVISSLGQPNCGSRSLRFTFGRETKKSDIDALLDALKNVVSGN